MEYRKVHSAPKHMLPAGKELSRVVLDTMKKISRIVGGTLGPGGRPVIIEHTDDLPPKVTKDGVTVFKALGFTDPIAHCIMEANRDIAVRTANEAGDGTTTATILAEAVVRYTHEFCEANPRFSPHRVVREIQNALEQIVLPLLQKQAFKVSLLNEKGKKVCRQVATISANGDDDLADAVMQCYDICGSEGNVTLAEAPGISRYEVQEIQGYPIHTGYDHSCANLYSIFLRDPGQHKTVLKSPMVILYYGQITEPSTIRDVLSSLRGQPGVWGQEDDQRDVLLVATRFSASVLETLALNWRTESTPKVFPLKTTFTAIHGSERAFLDDLAAVTGAVVYDPATNPLSNVDFRGVGMLQDEVDAEGRTIDPHVATWRGRTEAVEVCRDRTSVFGFADQDLIILRVEELKAALPGAGSKLETKELTERIARLAGGIARLTVYGTTNGETNEKRDRAEDAVCAVRGALREGVLYGGCWGLLYVANHLRDEYPSDAVLSEVLLPALEEPFYRLLENVGVPDDVEGGEPGRQSYRAQVGFGGRGDDDEGGARIFDALEMEVVDPTKAGIYDSAPAVIEAVRSSLVMATMVGTLGGAVVQVRDSIMERQEASQVGAALRDTNEMYSNNGMLPAREE